MQNKYVLLVLLFSMNLYAVDAKMRIDIQAHENIYTSQKIIVAVDLMTDAFSISDKKITFPTSSKYIVSAPDSAAYIHTEEINGTDWQVVRYEYEVYALKSGEIKLSSVKATFSASMGYGQPKKMFNLESSALYFSVRTPEGIQKDRFVLVTDNYSLLQKVEPKESELIVGDAIEVEIIQKAHSIPDIILSPIHYKSTPLLRVYEKEPLLQSGMKGTFDVSRTDKFTFVATAEGNVSIPEQSSVWWDITTQTVHKESIPAMTFRIIADPQIALDAKKAQQKKRLLYLIAILLSLLILYSVFGAKVRNFMKERKQLYERSEAGRFNTLLDTCQNNDTSKLYQDLYTWLEAADPKLSRDGFKGMSKLQPSFSKALSQLEEILIVPERTFDKTDFIKELKKFRGRLLEQHHFAEQGLPQNINPI